MPIKGITNHYRPTRQGKIHLGIKKKTDKGVEYPSETDYFVLSDSDLVDIYGEKPEELHVSLSSARFDKDFDSYLEKVFPQYLKRYKGGSGGVLVCKGNGEVADCIDAESASWKEEIPCPCQHFESKECKRMGILRIRIREIPTFNIFQISTSSWNSIVNINSFIRDLLEHCAVYDIDPSTVKLILRRREQKIQRMDNGRARSSTHYPLELDLDPQYYKSLDDIAAHKQLKAPKDEPKELPAPDESKDELFYPENGFKPKEPEKTEEPIKLNEDVKALKQSLEDTLDKYRELGGKTTQQQDEKIDFLSLNGDAELYQKTIDFYQKRIDKMEEAGKGHTENKEQLAL